MPTRETVERARTLRVVWEIDAEGPICGYGVVVLAVHARDAALGQFQEGQRGHGSEGEFDLAI